MNSRIVLALALLATVFAVDLTMTPNSFSADEWIVTSHTLALTNGAGSSLTSVSFTVTVNSSGVGISYGGGASKATVGTITNGATGYGGWSIVGPYGTYGYTFAITYKKGLTTYNTQHGANLLIIESGSGKREAILEVDLAEVEANGVAVAERSDDDDGDDDDNNSPPAPGLTIVPTAVTVGLSEPAWVPIGIKNIAGKKIKNVSFVVLSNNANIRINYKESCTPANGLGDINNNNWSNTSYQIGWSNANQAPAGSYNLNVQVRYQLDNKWKSQTATVSLSFNNSARSSLAFAYNVEDGSMKTEYVVGFGVGIACFAGLAVVGAAIIYRKRNAAATIA